MHLFKSVSDGNLGVFKKAIDPGIKLAVYMGQKARRSKVAQDIKKELAMGIKHEMEHTKDPQEARKIALEHLKKHRDYYSKLKKTFKKSTNTMLYLDISKAVQIKGRPGLQLVQTTHGKRWKKISPSDVIKVEDYKIVTKEGKPIRTATKVTFKDGHTIRFMEKMSKKSAIKQAIEQKEKGLSKAVQIKGRPGLVLKLTPKN